MLLPLHKRVLGKENGTSRKVLYFWVQCNPKCNVGSKREPRRLIEVAAQKQKDSALQPYICRKEGAVYL